MKIVSFGPVRAEQTGILRGDGRIVPLGALLVEAGSAPLTVSQFLGMLHLIQPVIEPLVDTARVSFSSSGVRLGPPVPAPEKIIVTGANYQAHLDEASGVVGAPSSTQPLMYLKPSNTVAGASDPLVRPFLTEQLDYEVELAVVIGRGGRNIAKADVFDHISGYMICNDLTARDLVGRDAAIHPYFLQLTRAKGIAAAPIGPWLVTKDEIPKPHELDIRTWVNGELRQSGNTRDMIFDIPAMVSDFSDALELSPGDIIMTGTTAGSGAAQSPPAFLKAGDVVRMEITGLGVMETPIVDETRASLDG
jgi:2-keto-4-pentenoate hydratase/2-oxohepta-3-ene-1,7-dioic acid hydratase in catechol pathway